MISPSHFATRGYCRKALMVASLCLVLYAGDGAYGRPVGETLRAGSRVGVLEEGIRASSEKRPQWRFSAEAKFEGFEDFIVHLKDDRKKDRILLCTVVVEMNRGMTLPGERTPLRRIIYMTLKERSGSSEPIKGLRADLKTRLNAFMGGERIRTIYLTKFVLL